MAEQKDNKSESDASHHMHSAKLQPNDEGPDTLLIHGYIRSIENTLQNERIIPLDIYHICFDFYFATKIIFYLAGLCNNESADESKIDLMCAVNLDNSQNWKTSIKELTDNETPITIKDAENNEKWAIARGGIEFTRNLKLPDTFPASVASNKYNNIVFRCGGILHDGPHQIEHDGTDYCAALIFNSHDFQIENNDNLTALNWKLPSLPHVLHDNKIRKERIIEYRWYCCIWV